MTITPLHTATECPQVELGSNRLPILASTINEHLAAAETATRRGLEHAIAAGILLLEAKELVAHGEWLTWLQANCQIGQRQVQAYMRLARNRHRLDAIKNAPGAYLTIHAAEALVGRPKPEPPHSLPGQLDMLGGEEVVARPSGLRGRALSDRIIDLEQALAILNQLGARGKRYRKFPRQADERRRGVIASIIGAAIADLKAQWRRQRGEHR
jgi:hypothetical protein